MIFKLSAQLIGHDSDIRGVTYASPNTVLTASRDGTVRRWVRSPLTAVPESFLVSQSSEYINAIAYIKPSDKYPEGLVVSGGKDTILDVRRLSSTPAEDAERMLVGHAANVCTIDISPNGDYIVSGGWDCQARVWSVGKWDTELILQEHELSVWAVLAYNETTVITGCADKKIRIYDLNKSIAGDVRPSSTIYCPDIIRALCRLPKGHSSGGDFACASNDGIIRIYKLNGQGVAELLGHNSYVYALAALPTGEIISSGEDRTARVWKNNECIQTITHPALSVWSVAVCPDTGDIVTASSDHVARIFTRNPERQANTELLSTFEEAVKASAIPQQQMGAINKEKVPGTDFLKTKSGTKDGQVQVIKHDDGSLAAYTWSVALQKWEHVGAIVDAAGGGQKKEYNGKMYDYVFDVDIDESKPPLKLPYNLSENVFGTARKFLEDNELPMTYLDNVVQFLQSNTQGTTITQSSKQSLEPVNDGKSTGPTARTLPQKTYVNLLNGKFDNIINKIHLINKTMINAGRKDKALNPAEEQALFDLRPCIEGQVEIEFADLNKVIKVATQWDYTDILPGLDMLRFLVRYPAAVEYSTPSGGTIVDAVINAVLAAPEGMVINVSCVVMSLRAIANLFLSENGEVLMSIEAEKAVKFLEKVVGVPGSGPGIGTSNRHVQIAATTSLINFSVLDGKTALPSSIKERIISVIGVILLAQADSEVLYRGLVALGTLVGYGKAGTDSEWKVWTRKVLEKVEESRVKALASEILRL